MQTRRHGMHWGLIAGMAGWLLAGLAPVWADEGLKIVTINVAKTFDGYQHTVDSDKQLEAKSGKKEEEHNHMVDEVKKLREGLDLLSDKAKEERQRQLEDKVRKLQEWELGARKELQTERDEMARQILGEIDKALQEYAQKQNYDLVLNERVIVYGKPSYDITDGFIQWLNQRYKPKP